MYNLLRRQVDAWSSDARLGLQSPLMIVADTRKAILPHYLEGEVGLLFRSPANARNLVTGNDGLWVTLRFCIPDQTPMWFRCYVPWSSITRLYDLGTLSRYQARAPATENVVQLRRPQ